MLRRLVRWPSVIWFPANKLAKHGFIFAGEEKKGKRTKGLSPHPQDGEGVSHDCVFGMTRYQGPLLEKERRTTHPLLHTTKACGILFLCFCLELQPFVDAHGDHDIRNFHRSPRGEAWGHRAFSTDRAHIENAPPHGDSLLAPAFYSPPRRPCANFCGGGGGGTAVAATEDMSKEEHWLLTGTSRLLLVLCSKLWCGGWFHNRRPCDPSWAVKDPLRFLACAYQPNLCGV